MRINRFRPLAGFASIHNNPTPPNDDDDGRRCVLGRGSEKLFYGRAPSVLKELSTHMVFCRAAEGEENNVCLCIWWVSWKTKNASALCRLILFAVRIFHILLHLFRTTAHLSLISYSCRKCVSEHNKVTLQYAVSLAGPASMAIKLLPSWEMRRPRSI